MKSNFMKDERSIECLKAFLHFYVRYQILLNLDKRKKKKKTPPQSTTASAPSSTDLYTRKSGIQPKTNLPPIKYSHVQVKPGDHGRIPIEKTPGEEKNRKATRATCCGPSQTMGITYGNEIERGKKINHV